MTAECRLVQQSHSGGCSGSVTAAFLHYCLTVRLVASTSFTPLMPRAVATAFCTASLLCCVPVRVTTPFTVFTLMSMLFTSLVVASSDFTLVVIQVSVPGCAALESAVADCEFVGVELYCARAIEPVANAPASTSRNHFE